MSSARGNTNRKRPQKHQNRTAFKNDLHDSSHKTKFINSLSILGVCKRCKDILEWKIKYKKYKPLTAPRKCTGCDQKSIKHAYHLLCNPCAKEKNVCPKCCISAEEQELIEDTQNQTQNAETDLKSMLKGLPERKRRTILRKLNKQEGGQPELTPEIKAQVEDMLSKMENVSLDDDSFFGDDDDDISGLDDDSDEECA